MESNVQKCNTMGVGVTWWGGGGGGGRKGTAVVSLRSLPNVTL